MLRNLDMSYVSALEWADVDALGCVCRVHYYHDDFCSDDYPYSKGTSIFSVGLIVASSIIPLHYDFDYFDRWLVVLCHGVRDGMDFPYCPYSSPP